MNTFFDLLKTDTIILGMLIAIIVLFILYVITVSNLKKLRNSYLKFMNKLGNGNNLDEMIKEYIEKVNNVEEKNDEISAYCKKIDDNMRRCTQKIGIVRYNAFKDTGSDLSFTLAILDDFNNGVVLNGIYARDNSNIYAKPIKNGESKYILSNEEKEAINRAINNIN